MEADAANDHIAGGNGRLPHALGGIARLAYARAKAAGLALEPLLKGAGITQSRMEDNRSRLKVQDQIKFLNLAADALEDPFLGFHLAQIPDLREIGLIYYVFASSERFTDALQRAARYTAIVNEGVSQTCIVGGEVGISYHYIGVSRHTDRHQMEFWMTLLVRMGRQLTGQRLLPSRTWLTHQRPGYGGELAEFLGDNVQFGATADEIIFPGRIGTLPLVSADPYLNKLLTDQFEEMLSHRSGGRASFRSSVENAIIPLLPHGKARTDEIASRLGVSKRTFARRLSTEGLTFSQVLEKLRYDLASQYLADEDLSISEISWLLGYQEIGAFSHAFKRWTGKTPRAARTNAAS